MDRILRSAFTLTLICTAHLASADDTKALICGNAKITVSPARVQGGQKVLQDFLVNISQSNSNQIFKFSPENDFLQLRCETKRDGDAIVLVNHYCGGSGCSESNFSIIDLKTYKVLLNANARQKGNHSAAETILGKKIKPFSCGRTQDELCYSAKFE
jgi:hypothetical protein